MMQRVKNTWTMSESFMCTMGGSVDIYGNTFTVYNVHSLIHLPDDVEHFRCSLNGVSGFPFENYMQTLSDSFSEIFQSYSQMSRRTRQSTKCRQNSTKFFTKERFTHISTRPGDCCFMLQNKDFVFVKKICEEEFLQ